jgi:hypothetical protein
MPPSLASDPAFPRPAALRLHRLRPICTASVHHPPTEAVIQLTSPPYCRRIEIHNVSSTSLPALPAGKRNRLDSTHPSRFERPAIDSVGWTNQRRATNRIMVDFTDRLKPAHNGTATLQAERAGSGIDVDQLAQHLLGRDDFLKRQEKVLRVLSKEKVFSKDQQLNLSRPERYHLGLARAKAIQRLMRREGWDHEDYSMAEYLTDEMSPYFLHMSMFGESTQACS